MMGRAFVVVGAFAAMACGSSTDASAPLPPADRSVADGGDCRADLQCVSGACFPTDNALGCGRCGARVSTGACYSDAHCAVGSHCAFTDTDAGVCAPNDAGTATGCSSACAAGSVCVGSTCRTLGKAGELCAPSGDVNTCEAGLICPPVGKTCVVPRSLTECRPQN